MRIGRKKMRKKRKRKRKGRIGRIEKKKRLGGVAQS